MTTLLKTNQDRTFQGENTGLPASTRMATRLNVFRRDEDGSVIVMTLFIFLFMMVMAGLGIDTMRHEMERAKLQSTLDSAVLAGAGAPQGSDPKAIVKDYFAKSDMSQYLQEFQDGDIASTLSSSRVSARASMTMDTYLMKLSGVDTLSAFAASTAVKRIPKLEVVLVLDVSGSMGDNSKIDNLQIAAKDFVTNVMAASNAGDTVISIVPFSTSVTPSDGIFEELAVAEKHSYSNCVYLEESDFTHPALATGGSANAEGSSMKHAVYTSMYGGFDNLNSDWRSCYTDEYFRILPYSISETQLHNKIDSLLAAGNTSTEQGVKYGSALLNWRFREVSEALIANGEIDASLTNVPADYGQADTMKVMIIMGDGENTTTYFFDKSSPKYRGANSDLFLVKYQDQKFEYAFRKRNKDRQFTDLSYESKCSNNKWVCIYSADGPVKSAYYLKDPTPTDRNGDGVVDVFYGIEQDKWYDADHLKDLANILTGFISSEDLSWETAWGLMSPNYYGQITGDWEAWNDYRNSEQITGATKNRRMVTACNTVKSEGVYVYSIGFEVPKNGVAEQHLEDCASSPSYYFRAEGIDITQAFSAIAGNVQNLRLTQ